jgi:hypothetical protein
MRRRDRHDADTGLALLPTFFLGTLVMVLAIVGMARIDSGWADLAAVAVLVIVAGALLLAIGRRLGDEDDDDDLA